MNEIGFFLIVLHYLGDYPLQGTYLAMNKAHDDYLLFAHSMIWAGLICAGLYYFNMLESWKVIYLVVGHFAIDKAKCNIENPKYTDQMLDQMLHMVQLFTVTM